MPADGSASTKCASARYSDRHGTDVDAAGARSRAMDPDESTIHSSYKSCSEKCSRGANQAYPTSLSRFAARDSLVTPETPPDRTPVPTRKRASAPGALNLAMRRHPVLSGRPGRFYPIGASRFARTACVARRRMFDSRPLWARLRANSPRYQCARCFSTQIGGGGARRERHRSGISRRMEIG
jgi:hypothetical protein